MKPKRRRKRWIIWLLLALLVGGFVAAKLFRKPDDAIAVQTELVSRRDLTEIVVANGRIQPVTQVMISPEVAGEIVQLPVEEGQAVKKGDLLVQIRPDNYMATRNSAEASYQFAQGSRNQAQAELLKAETLFRQNEELRKNNLVAENVYVEFRTAYELAKLRLANSIHQANQAKFALDKANDDLARTTISSPMDGTITRLKSQLGERVLGTSFNMGTEIMTVANLEEMEARVDIGEIDIVLIQPQQKVRIEVDAFKERTFRGTVTAIANAAKGQGTATQLSSSSSQEAPKFEVRIRIDDKEAFRPGMSVTAEIETRSRTAALAVPIQSVTTRLPKAGMATPTPSSTPKPGTKGPAPVKPVEVVFALEGDTARMVPVVTGISDNDYYEIVSGLTEGQRIITGGYKAVSKDLEDGKKVTVGGPASPPGTKEGK